VPREINPLRYSALARAQVILAAVEFADNPEPRCPCLLLIDVSGSMSLRLSRVIDSLLFLARAEHPETQIRRDRLDVAREWLRIEVCG